MPAPASAPPPAAAAEAAAPRPTPPSAPALADSAPMMSESADFETDAPTNYFRLPILTPSAAGDRRLIYTINMRLQTTEFLPGMRLLLDEVVEADGYLVRKHVRGTDWRRPAVERSVEFQFRIPTEQLAYFIFVIENNYNILELRQDMVELTAQYQQTDWHLEELREQESQLLERLETAEGDEWIALSEHLRSVRWSIRDLEGWQTTIRTNVAYSTVDIVLHEVFLPEYDGIPAYNIALWVFIAMLVVAVMVLGIVLANKKSEAPKEPTA